MATVRKILTIVLFVLMLIAMAIGLVSCDNASYSQTQVKENENTGEVTYTVRGVEFHVVEIDGCEYLMGYRYRADGSEGYITHKGNCKYCEERRRNEY